MPSMSVDDVVFRVSLMVFGTGLYFMAEHPRLALALIIVGGIGILYYMRAHLKAGGANRATAITMILAALIFCLAVGFDYYSRQWAPAGPQFVSSEVAELTNALTKCEGTSNNWYTKFYDEEILLKQQIKWNNDYNAAARRWARGTPHDDSLSKANCRADFRIGGQVAIVGQSPLSLSKGLFPVYRQYS